MHISIICLIIYHTLTCFGCICYHHQGVIQEYKHFTNNFRYLYIFVLLYMITYFTDVHLLVHYTV